MLRIETKILSPSLIVLDKDGTLIHFDDMWHTWFEKIVIYLEQHLPHSDELTAGLAGTLGYDPATDAWDPLGPLTLASTKEVALLIASQIYRYAQIPWDHALATVMAAENRARDELSTAELVQPIGDVRLWLQRARESGHLLALATTDDRSQTLQALEQLQIAELFSTIVCGDDGYALKPAPDMANIILNRLSISANNAIIIGDTNADMLMGKRAGFACAIGVTSGALRAKDLETADIVIPNLHAIEII